ncbi:ATP-dependent DNA helicase [Natranaerofaba carboxydovora]|uniref:ATP-dependent DNA helicase n=1 Tax=Natranaerofaba carboxydovora TaxID=2742683 RepID=UPI001F141C39|nr:ATP-dependent DNA helicase [Natranaerofaba carboxydovora]
MLKQSKLVKIIHEYCQDQESPWDWYPYVKEVLECDYIDLNLEVESDLEVANELQPPTLDDVEDILQDEKVLKKYLPDYSLRDGQAELAAKIKDTLVNGGYLCAEAPTGLGKSLPYLLVTLLWLHENKGQVVIATANKSLQEDILENEFPKIVDSLNLTGIKHLKVKGRENYVCLNKHNKFINGLDTSEDEIALAIYLENWIEKVESGDIDEDLSYWFEINYWKEKEYSKSHIPLKQLLKSDRIDCEGNNCSFNNKCKFNEMKQKLETAKLIVVNQSLLTCWPKSYPEIKLLIVDEAHNLRRNMIEGGKIEVSSSELKWLLNDFYNSNKKEGGPLFYLINYYNKTTNKKKRLHQFNNIINETHQIINKLESQIKKHFENNGWTEEYEEKKRLKKEKDSLKFFKRVEKLASNINQLSQEVTSIVNEIKEIKQSFDQQPLAMRIEEFIKRFEFISKLLYELRDQPGDSDGWCYYGGIKIDKSWFLGKEGLNKPFTENIIANLEAGVFTSATLRVEEKFDYFKKTINLNDARNTRHFYIGHIFDYQSNCRLAIPTDISIYKKEDKFIKEVSELLVKVAKTLNGRTLFLGHSTERLEKIYGYAYKKLEKENILVLSPEDSKKKGKEFLESNKRVVVLGSRTFFEGVNIPGPSLSCVLIEKVGFKHPSDPLNDKLREEKGKTEAFQYDVKRVSMELKQMFGRLTRTPNDYGYVFVLNQLIGDDYQSKLRNELPPAEIVEGTTDEIINRMKSDFAYWEGSLDLDSNIL